MNIEQRGTDSVDKKCGLVLDKKLAGSVFRFVVTITVLLRLSICSLSRAIITWYCFDNFLSTAFTSPAISVHNSPAVSSSF